MQHHPIHTSPFAAPGPGASLLLPGSTRRCAPATRPCSSAGSSTPASASTRTAERPGLPDRLGPFLSGLAERRPRLRACVLQRRLGLLGALMRGLSRRAIRPGGTCPRLEEKPLCDVQVPPSESWDFCSASAASWPDAPPASGRKHSAIARHATAAQHPMARAIAVTGHPGRAPSPGPVKDCRLRVAHCAQLSAPPARRSEHRSQGWVNWPSGGRGGPRAQNAVRNRTATMFTGPRSLL